VAVGQALTLSVTTASSCAGIDEFDLSSFVNLLGAAFVFLSLAPKFGRAGANDSNTYVSLSRVLNS
jgi:hypothetical protein